MNLKSFNQFVQTFERTSNKRLITSSTNVLDDALREALNKGKKELEESQKKEEISR